jgi:uncharacterized protein YgfB (UPF0149 family)
MQADYKMINLLLTGNHVQHSAAELHGLLAGQLCSGVAHPDPQELGELLEYHGELAPVVVKLCERLATETADQLGQLDFQFQPLLPPDDAELPERVDALGLWCDGFTVGFAAGFIQPEEILSEEARELLGDLGRLSAVSASAEDCSEQDEVDYMELVEYVRMAAITLFQQLASPGIPDSEAGDQQVETLH